MAVSDALLLAASSAAGAEPRRAGRGTRQGHQVAVRSCSVYDHQVEVRSCSVYDHQVEVRSCSVCDH